MGGGASFVLSCPIPGSARFRLEKLGRLAPFGKAVIVLVPTGRVGTLYPSSAPAGEPTLSGAPLSPCFAAESTRGGTLMSLPEGIATPLR